MLVQFWVAAVLSITDAIPAKHSAPSPQRRELNSGDVLEAHSSLPDAVALTQAVSGGMIRQRSLRNNPTVVLAFRHKRSIIAPGLLWGLLGAALAIILGLLLVRSRRNHKEAEAAERNCTPRDIAEGGTLKRGVSPESWRRLSTVDYDYWQDLSDQGELDMYSAFALSFGRDHRSSSTLQLLPRMLILFVLQLGLATLFIMYQIREHQFFPVTQGYIYRFIGTLLYCYSVWRMYESQSDGCRDWLIDLMLRETVSNRYILPVLMGELINVFVSCTLMVTLFLIFCRCHSPQDLLINAIAINFVADIDNQLVTASDCRKAKEDFRAAVDEWMEDGDHTPRNPIFHTVWEGCRFIIHGLQCIVPIAGCFLALFFTFAHDASLCDSVRLLDPWPFCIGIDL